MMEKLILTAFFLVGFSISAAAQTSIENLYCSDYYWFRVQIIPDSSGAFNAYTDISTYGVPQICINPMQLRDLSSNVRAFAVWHAYTNLTLGKH